ncbi:hypothetical protein [Sorangium sp. So ce233]|uniref:hypothetical protein n=1 Tax=Sorangium sp. So ce233 TaxID=3133290 RepID=UPI003F5D9FD5
MTSLSPTLIEAWIADFLVSADPKLEWLKAPVRAHRFLPLYVGWSSTLGLRPDGSFVRWDQEAASPGLRPLSIGYWQRMAICQAAKTRPELASLLPPRPVDAVTCSVCGGAGTIAGAPQIVCECGGAGWSIPAEDKSDPPG